MICVLFIIHYWEYKATSKEYYSVHGVAIQSVIVNIVLVRW